MSYSSFNLNPKCLERIARTKIASLFQYLQRGLYRTTHIECCRNALTYRDMMLLSYCSPTNPMNDMNVTN